MWHGVLPLWVLPLLAAPVTALGGDCPEWSAEFAPSGASGALDVLHRHDAGDGAGEQLYAAGYFGAVTDTVALGVARWDGAAWNALAGGVEVSRQRRVEELLTLDLGAGPRLVAVGGFLSVDGAPANGVATWDGTAWSTLAGGPPVGANQRLELYDAEIFDAGAGDELWVGGAIVSTDFTSLNRPYLARWDGATWTQVTAGPNAPVCDPYDFSCDASWIDALQVFDDGTGDALYVGGQFDTVGASTPATILARYDGAAWTIPAGTGPGGIEGRVISMFLHDDGSGSKLVLHGAFAPAPHSQLITYDGASFSTFGAGPPHYFLATKLLPAHIGRPAGLWTAQQRPLSSTGLFEMSVWDGLSWTTHHAPMGYPVDVFAFDAYDSGGGAELVVGGEFATPLSGVAASNLARWDGTSWSGLGAGGAGFSSIYSSGEGFVAAVEAHDDGSGPAVFMGGEIVSSGGSSFANLVRWDGATLTAIPGFTLPYLTHVEALQSWDFGAGPVLLIAGDLKIGSTNPRGLAVWDGTTLGGFGTTTSSEGVGFAVFDDGGGEDVYFATDFSVFRLADATTVESIGMSGAIRVNDVCVHDDGAGPQLYVAGLFHTIAGVPANNVVRWDGQTWSAVGDGLGDAAQYGGGEVHTLAVYDNGDGPKLYAGGSFTTSGPHVVQHLARWNGSAWRQIGGGLQADGAHIHAMEVFDDGSGAGPRLYIGGDFEVPGAPTQRGLVVYDGDGLDAGGLLVDGPLPVVRELESIDLPGFGGRFLAIGGDFDAIDGVAAQRFTTLTACDALGASLCAGDGIGTGVACPCGNASAPGSGEGCVNSQGHGARISATGTQSVAADDLALLVTGARPGQPGVWVQGASEIATSFRDGVLCAGNPTERLGTVFLDGAGAGASALSIVTEGNVAPGQARVYQLWYRDPQISACGTGSNLSNAVRIVWTP